MSVLLIDAVVRGSVLAAIGSLVLVPPLIWVAKSTIESALAMNQLEARVADQRREVRQTIDTQKVTVLSLRDLEETVSKAREELARDTQRLEVIEADQVRVASIVEMSMSVMRTMEDERAELDLKLGALLAMADAHGARIGDLESPRRQPKLPTGARPELNLRLALSSLGQSTLTSDEVNQDSGSNDPGSGGSRSSNG